MNAPPLQIGRYRVLAELGQGGTANVYLAVARGIEGFNKLVVLKRMKAQLSSEPGFASTFLDEARLAARLGHANIVQTYEVFKDGELPVIVMEYLEGQTLANVIARSADREGLELRHHLAIISEALSGLHYSHELRDFDSRPLEVVHRDMTPHNVFVAFDGRVKLLDFGIAKLSGSLVETESGVIKGKLRYIPPEQIVQEDVDRRADLYSVGVMLWEAATGQKIWRGLSDATIMNRVLNGEIPAPSAANPDVDPELERIVVKAMSPRREDRHATARELQEEIDAHRANLPRQGESRSLGVVVERLFEAERAERKRAIETHLSTERLTQSASVRSSEERTPPSFAVSERATAASSGRPLLRIALALVIMGFLVALLWPRRANDAAPRASASAPPETSTDAAGTTVRPAESVEIRVVALPPTALISIDGNALRDNPATLVVGVDDRAHEVRAEAPGYEAAVEATRFDANRSIVLELSRQLEPVASALPESSDELGLRKPAPPTSLTLNPSCEPPFVIDPRGIKRFKPECVK